MAPMRKRSASPAQEQTPEYVAWISMRRRCTAKNRPQYHNYGGRGIRFCARWGEFANFLEDMGPRPAGDYSLDRINNDGNYEPGNCRWASRKEQNRNRATTRLTQTDIPFIRHWLDRGYTQVAIGKAFGVDSTHICKIKSGRKWAEARA